MRNLLFTIIFFQSCIGYKSEADLAILGPKETVEKTVDGKQVVDTIYHTIPNFSFQNQEGNQISASNYDGLYYVTDFFFTSCPTICPIMTKNMLKVYDEFEGEERLKFLSHSIDTRHDSVPVLKKYADKIGVNANRWSFVTGSKEDIYGIAEYYLVAAAEDENAPGGYIHSGALILVDPQKRIRGYYDGTQDNDITRLIRELKAVLKHDAKLN